MMEPVGSYGHLYVDGSPIFSFRNAVDPAFMLLFTRGDVRHSVDQAGARVSSGDPRDEFEVLEFAITSEVLRDRLAVLGLGEARITGAFEDLVADRLARRREWTSEERFGSEFRDHLETEIAELESLDLERWKAEVCRHIAAGDPSDERTDIGSLGWLLSLWERVDPRLVLRAIGDAMPTAEIILDVTDLREGGWLEDNVDPQEVALTDYGWALAHGAPAIVLAEGKTDIKALSSALLILRPHLEGFLRFVDFEMKPEGGAAALTRTVRAFAAAGVANRIVALFDNDTAGSEAARSLGNSKLPSNITVLQYPDIEVARTYPTLGPSGLTTMDVNGLACGVEMYLGDDVLRDSDGILCPVQWTGFVRSLRQYQGELVGKPDLWERFEEKTRVALRDPPSRSAQDWGGLSLILDTVIEALSTSPND